MAQVMKPKENLKKRELAKELAEISTDILENKDFQKALNNSLPKISKDFSILFNGFLDVHVALRLVKWGFDGISELRKRKTYIKLMIFMEEVQNLSSQWGDFGKRGIKPNELLEFLLENLDHFETYIKARIQAHIINLLAQDKIDLETFKYLTFSLRNIHPSTIESPIYILLPHTGEINVFGALFTNVGLADQIAASNGGQRYTLNRNGRIFVEKCLNPALKSEK